MMIVLFWSSVRAVEGAQQAKSPKKKRTINKCESQQ